MTDQQHEGAIVLVLTVFFLALLDGSIIWLGWNQFVTEVSDFHRITFFSGVAAAMLKMSITQGFGLRYRRSGN